MAKEIDDTLRITDINHPHLRILHDSQLLNSDVWSVIRGGFHPDKPQVGEWCLLTYFQTDYGQNSYLTPGVLGNSFIQPVAPSMPTRIVKIVADDPLKIVEYSLEDGHPVETDKTQDYGNPENIAWSRLPEIRPLTKSDMAAHQRDSVSGYYIPVRAKRDRLAPEPLLTRTVEIGLSDTVLKRVESL